MVKKGSDSISENAEFSLTDLALHILLIAIATLAIIGVVECSYNGDLAITWGALWIGFELIKLLGLIVILPLAYYGTYQKLSREWPVKRVNAKIWIICLAGATSASVFIMSVLLQKWVEFWGNISNEAALVSETTNCHSIIAITFLTIGCIVLLDIVIFQRKALAALKRHKHSP